MVINKDKLRFINAKNFKKNYTNSVTEIQVQPVLKNMNSSAC